MIRAAAFFLLLVLLAGCGGAAVAPAPPTPLPGQSAADAQATLAAWQLAIGATATTAAQHTQATAAAIEARQATVAAATVVALSTRDALTLQTTAVALQMSIDSATSTAEAAAAQATSAAGVQQTADAAEMAAVAIVQQDTAIRLEQERRVAETRLHWLPVLYGVGIFALLALGVAGLAFVWFLIHRARYTLLNPVVELPNGGALARLPDGRGGFGAPQLVTITAPARPVTTQVPALPAPAPQPAPLPSLAGAHVLIVGPTTTGKSNVLRQVAKGLAGSSVYAIDTNYRPGAWPATVREVVGAAGDYDRVADLMAWLDGERRSRIARYAKGDAQFNPVTLIMDEQWELANCVPTPAMAAWKAVVRQGAKYGIYVVMATHSLLVKEMGLEGESSVIENFQHRIYLGPLAVKRYPALDGTERPAIYMRGGSRRATPIVIPYHPEEDHRSPQFRVPAVLPAVNSGLYWGGSSALADGLFNRGHERKDAIVLPAPAAERPIDPRVDGLTSRGWVGPLEVGKILEAHATGLPHYKIEIAAFGYNEQGRPRCNGAFYHQVEDVLAFYGLSTGSTSSTGSTAVVEGR